MTREQSFLPNPSRINIPFVLDIIIVSNPEQIKRIESSSDVDRLHAYPTAELPWWVKYYLSATRFHTPQDDNWFLPFESSANREYQKRRSQMDDQIARGYRPQDITKIADLLVSNADDSDLSFHMAQLIAGRFSQAEIPLDICLAGRETLQRLPEAINPVRYAQAKKAHGKLYDFCAHNLLDDYHLVDAGQHTIAGAAKSMVDALHILKENINLPVDKIFTKNPITLQAPRIAIRDSDLGGLLKSKTKPGWTVVIFQIAKAAQKTSDLYFTFGTGTSERACSFMNFFLDFMKDLQMELIDRTASVD
ncbi:hypothetical protein [Acaryochloris sp. CCMEE 5410]|uniref:hypothetical protein n=1 Tax=Acaryochloris sp. CCMEE 5410 TaxID=310037 RepID=UPI00024846BC|nr:hypothetical protein [Acaryochloris sp. CCMEE 5410]KAI9131315.1 hypothetical protein ON05_027125 [Acaryochloris sp. CCMEE 5410]